MSENLFQPMYLLWIALIAMTIVWSWEALKRWYTTRRGHNKFHKNHSPVLFN